MRYNFEWDPVKAKKNLRKHNVSFEESAEVFWDPLATSIFDEEHSDYEERWITMGETKQGVLLVVIHTFSEELLECNIRIISARKATKKEIKQYKQGV